LHGFATDTPASLKNGSGHSVTIRFETASTIVPNGSTQLNCAPNYLGHLDQADCDTIRGWAVDLNRLNTPISVSIYDGSTLITVIPADQLRPYVGSLLGDNGLHGFSIDTPASLKTSSAHRLNIRFETSSTNLINSLLLVCY